MRALRVRCGGSTDGLEASRLMLAFLVCYMPLTGSHFYAANIFLASIGCNEASARAKYLRALLDSTAFTLQQIELAADAQDRFGHR